MSRFSETLMDHFQAPRNYGRMECPDFVGIVGTPGQGRFLVLYLQVANERVASVRFESHGCGVTIACGSALSELIAGQTLQECSDLTSSDLEKALDGLPPDKRDCSDFALWALQGALNRWRLQTCKGPVAPSSA